MRRPPKPNFEEERAIKEEAARLLRSFQHGEYCTKQNIIKHSPEIQRILARSFVAHNNMTCNNSYCSCVCDFYKYGKNDEDNPGTLLFDDDVQVPGDYVWGYPIWSRDCRKRLGYLMNHFTEDKTSCLCQCHHNNHKKSRTRHRPSTTGITYSSFAECSGGNTTDMITCYTVAITRRRSCPGWKGRIGHNDNFTNYN
jgi:hypothetical protein